MLGLSRLNEISKRINLDQNFFDRVYAEIFAKHCKLDGRKALLYVRIRQLLESPKAGMSEQILEDITWIINEYPGLLKLQDKAGNTLLFYAAQKNSQALEKMLTYKEAKPDIMNNEGKTYQFYVQEAKTEKVLEDAIKYSLEKQADLFSKGFVIGRTILKPGIDYIDDGLTGVNPDKSVYSYYLDQFSLKNTVQGVIYSATQFGLLFVPVSSNTHKSYIAKTLTMANTALFAKLSSDAIYGDIELSIKYADQLVSYMLGAVTSIYGQICISGTSFYANYPFAMGVFASITPDLIKLGYHASQQTATQEECKEYNEYQQRALYEGVTKSQSCFFYNKYQLSALKNFKIPASEAVEFYSQIQISALRATGVVSEALKFENKYQLQAYNIIKNVELSLEIDDLYKFRALKWGAQPEDAINFSNECQIQVLMGVISESHCPDDFNNG